MTPVDLSTFTPSMATPEALEATFVQRHALADRLVAVIRESATTDSKHHVLMIGPRGIGKTHLYELLSRGALPSYKVGRRRLLNPRDVERFWESCRCEVDVRQPSAPHTAFGAGVQGNGR